MNIVDGLHCLCFVKRSSPVVSKCYDCNKVLEFSMIDFESRFYFMFFWFHKIHFRFGFCFAHLIFGPLLDFVCEGMHNGMGSPYRNMMPNGTPQGPGQRPPHMAQMGQSPGGPGMRQPYPGMTPLSYGQTPTQGAQMSPHAGPHLGPGGYPGSPVPHPGMTQPGLHVNPQNHLVSHQTGNHVVV